MYEYASKLFELFVWKALNRAGFAGSFLLSFNFLFPLYFVIVTLFDLFACHLFPYIVLYFPLILIRCSFIRMKGLLRRCRLCLINIGGNVDLFNVENDEISYVHLLQETLQIEVHFVKYDFTTVSFNVLFMYCYPCSWFLSMDFRRRLAKNVPL